MTNRKWAAFRVSDIFNISTGSLAAKSIIKDGNFPRITARSTDNGIDSFTQLNTLFRTNENCVSISFLGSCFYQPYNASYDMKIHSVTIKNRPLNRHIGLFLANQFNREFKKFSYGNQLSSTDLVRQHVLLPVAADGAPDWQFMEDFMRQKEQQILKPTLDKICKQLTHNQKKAVQHKLPIHKWKEFDFTDVFTDIQRGKRLKKADHTEGNSPYVSSTSQSNGVDGFIGNTSNIRSFADCLTIANSGSVGSTFYHRYRFVASDHVTRLQREGLDKYAYLFMVPIINRLAEKYSFNREINDERIKREKLLLPIDEKGGIDFAFMSAFMREVEYNILNTTLKYFFER